MRLSAYWIALGSIALALCGCGYIGDPLPPALNIPVRITDLNAVERGTKLVIDFTIPETTTEQLILKRRGEVELEVGGQRIAVPADTFGATHIETPASPFVGRQVSVRVRVLNVHGRASEWSNEVKLEVVEPLTVPSKLAASAVPQGVVLRWESPRGKTFRVFRGKDQLTIADKPEWIDPQTAYGKTYEYSVQALLGAAESEIAGPVSITPEDKFPPAVPAGLQLIVGTGAVELVWDRNTESDLKGYRVYRSNDGGALQMIADAVETPSYSDKTVQSGKKYKYTVSAIDQKNNESAQTEPVAADGP